LNRNFSVSLLRLGSSDTTQRKTAAVLSSPVRTRSVAGQTDAVSGSAKKPKLLGMGVGIVEDMRKSEGEAKQCPPEAFCMLSKSDGGIMGVGNFSKKRLTANKQASCDSSTTVSSLQQGVTARVRGAGVTWRASRLWERDLLYVVIWEKRRGLACEERTGMPYGRGGIHNAGTHLGPNTVML